MVTDKIERPGQLQAFLFTMQYSNAGITNYTSSILHMWVYMCWHLKEFHGKRFTREKKYFTSAIENG